MPCLAVTMQVDAALADALADALLEAGAQSVAIDQPDSAMPSVQALLAPQTDPAALIAAAAAACGIADAPAFGIARVDDQDWVRLTQAQFSPLIVGRRLWVGAHWHEPPADRLVVRLDPGLAFGTGSHPTTRLSLRLLESRLRGGERVLDYGCGSGILAIAAARLGAAAVDAVDVDAQAVEVAATNAAENRVTVRTFLPEALPPDQYDVVIANILAQPLIVLAPLLASLVVRGGRLALSGLLSTQAEEVRAAYAPWIDWSEVQNEDAWALIAGVRR